MQTWGQGGVDLRAQLQSQAVSAASSATAIETCDWYAADVAARGRRYPLCEALQSCAPNRCGLSTLSAPLARQASLCTRVTGLSNGGFRCCSAECGD